MNAQARIVNALDSLRPERSGGKTPVFPVWDDVGLERPRQAWQWMRQTLQPPGELDWVRREVAEAWRRCIEDYGMRFRPQRSLTMRLPQGMGLPDVGVHPGLLDFFAQFEKQPYLRAAEAGLTLCLADAYCRLVAIHGRDLGDCPFGRLLGQPQADWSESAIGNNGIGSAAVALEAIAFSGEEHYLPLLHPFATAGYPLRLADGRLLGVLGLVSERRIAAGVLKSLVCLLGRLAEETMASVCLTDRGRAGEPFPLRILRPAPPPGKMRASGEAAAPAGKVADFASQFVEKAVRLQQRRIPILVVGESGAGKEYLVRRAYEAGPRRSGPFIAVNCASIPRDLIESELFGYESGSFTGARKEGKAGKFLLADKGVLLLDEIGDMGLDLQAVLLRVLENSEFYPVGGSKPVRVDVQIFAATNVPINQAVKEGKFRRDLYYRLNGAQLILPPLREREDKESLILQLLEKELALSGRQGPVRLSDEVMATFLRHPWPGNVRQLSNVIRSSLHLAEGDTISLTDLPDDFFEEMNENGAASEKTERTADPSSEPNVREEFQSPALSLADWELKGIKHALKSCKGNLSQAARALGITRGTLYKKMSEYGLSAR